MAAIHNDVQKSIGYLTEVETLAQEILNLREKKLELSNACNKFNEAFRALQKSEDAVTLLEVGNIFIEMSTLNAIALMQEEKEKAAAEENQTHEEIRHKLNKMRDLEHLPEIHGFGLKPMSGAEARAISKGFGIN